MLPIHRGGVDARGLEGAVEGDGHPEGAIAAEGGGGKRVFAMVLEQAGGELGEATEEEAHGVDKVRGGCIDGSCEDALPGGQQVGVRKGGMQCAGIEGGCIRARWQVITGLMFVPEARKWSERSHKVQVVLQLGWLGMQSTDLSHGTS